MFFGFWYKSEGGCGFGSLLWLIGMSGGKMKLSFDVSTPLFKNSKNDKKIVKNTTRLEEMKQNVTGTY